MISPDSLLLLTCCLLPWLVAVAIVIGAIWLEWRKKTGLKNYALWWAGHTPPAGWATRPTPKSKVLLVAVTLALAVIPVILLFSR